MSPLNFGNHPDPECVCGLWICLGGGLRCQHALVFIFIDDTVVDEVTVMLVQTRGAAWQQAVFQTNFQQRGNAGTGDNSGGSGKLLISNLDFGVNDADIQVSSFNIVTLL